ncbi:MAG: hypothetical protein FJ148_21585 [Deltaproteobacteria bacterium]|nr:hypothetical protein [Deltaproteobacteria bacterium]
MPRRDERFPAHDAPGAPRSARLRRGAARALVAIAALGGAPAAHAWQLVDVTNGYGDHSTAIV